MVDLMKRVFSSMKESARAQHEVDQAEFEAVKAESRAYFEAHRGRNTFAKAKAAAKESWGAAHISRVEADARAQAVRDEKIDRAKARTAAANARWEAARQ